MVVECELMFTKNMENPLEPLRKAIKNGKLGDMTVKMKDLGTFFFLLYGLAYLNFISSLELIFPWYQRRTQTSENCTLSKPTESVASWKVRGVYFPRISFWNRNYGINYSFGNRWIRSLLSLNWIGFTNVRHCTIKSNFKHPVTSGFSLPVTLFMSILSLFYFLAKTTISQGVLANRLGMPQNMLSNLFGYNITSGSLIIAAPNLA